MAQASHSVTVPVSVNQVWDFVSKIEKWATLVPAYKEHEQIDENKSVWTFEGNMKGLKKTVQIELNIVELSEPNNIKFEFKGITENFSGSGQFQAEAHSDGTKMTGTVEATAGGIAAVALNPMIKMVLPKVTTRLTEKIARTLQSVGVN
ncbi:SRPBCC family protein [Lysinibacillus sp. KU-BSD001]|uniref:CoxG family protein n=1 Tax=Lysinibacillus sp. KU-BSD001 TaxID=3141328 RepID=UPI0036E412B5